MITILRGGGALFSIVVLCEFFVSYAVAGLSDIKQILPRSSKPCVVGKIITLIMVIIRIGK